MRKLIIITGAALIACACTAIGGEAYTASLNVGAETSGTVQFARPIRGTVDTVYVNAFTNGVLKANEEAVVGIKYRTHTGIDAELIVTNTVSSGAATWRPRVIGTTTAGVALDSGSALVAVESGTNAVASIVKGVLYESVVLTGEPVTVSVSSSTTQTLWRVVIVTK